jgi:hypothetical protein
MLHIFSVAHILTCTSPVVHILMCCVYHQWRTSWYVAYIVSGAHPDMLHISSVAHILTCTFSLVHVLTCCIYHQWHTSWYVACILSGTHPHVYIPCGAHPYALHIFSVAHILICTSPVAHILICCIYPQWHMPCYVTYFLFQCLMFCSCVIAKLFSIAEAD